MNKILAFLRNEPVALAAFGSALVTLFAAFGLHLSNEQVAALGAVFTAVTGLLARSQVSPTEKE